MSHLDINTEKGQESLLEEAKAYNIFIKHYGDDFMIIQTPKDRECAIDAFLIDRNKTIVSVIETKCRNMTANKLINMGNTWLITFEKILKAATISKLLCVPLYGFLYLVPESVLMIIKLTDDKGELMPDMKIQRSVTQRTINGGEIERVNAYIDMNKATYYE